jgi:hypothetical protein
VENHRRGGLRALQFFQQTGRLGHAGLTIRQRKAYQNGVEILGAQKLKPFARINGRNGGGAQYSADGLCGWIPKTQDSGRETKRRAGE